MKNKFNFFIAAVLFCLVISPIVHAEYPAKPIKVTVPFGAGGGTDTLVRTLQKYVEKQLGTDLVVLNAPGAGSVTGSRSVINKKNDGYSVLVNHATLLTSMAIGKANFSVNDFEIAACTTSIPLVVAVPIKSKINSIKDLSTALSGKDPVIAGVNIGAVNHFALLLLEEKLKAGKFRYVQTGGGAKVIAALLGERITVGILSGSEATPLVKAGEVKIIAVLTENRIDQLPKVMTAKEQGIDIDFSIEHTWYFPKNTDPKTIQVFANALKNALASPELKATLKVRGIEATYYGPEVAPTRVEDSLNLLKEIAKSMKK